MEYLLIAIAILVVGLGAAAALVIPRRRSSRLDQAPPRAGVDYRPGVGDDAEVPRDTPTRSVGATAELPELDAATVQELEAALAPATVDEPAPTLDEPAPALDVPEPTAGRLTRLRARLSRSGGALGRGLLAVLGRDRLDEDAWEEIEESLIGADVGVGAAMEIVEALRTRTRVAGTRDPGLLRDLLAQELTAVLHPEMDRSLSTRADGRPAVVLVVGVNGTGKTTTCGKLARVLVADGRSVLLGAADTFRAAAADQLQTWGERVGAATVRGPEGGDPASIAFDAVKAGIDAQVDTVLIDTAGRLHTKVGLMDELGKVKRVIEKQGPVDEILLVLDATTGQNGLTQARMFTDVVDVTGIVLTKLDGSAKGGIIIAVQRELGVPVKLIGLGEGPDDLAPFEVAGFVDALLADA